jgi:hypothetical protein
VFNFDGVQLCMKLNVGVDCKLPVGYQPNKKKILSLFFSLCVMKIVFVVSVESSLLNIFFSCFCCLNKYIYKEGRRQEENLEE